MKTKLKMWIGIGAYVLTNAGYAAIAATQPSLDSDRAQQNEAVQTETLVLPIANSEGGEGGEGGEEGSTLDTTEDSTMIEESPEEIEDSTTIEESTEEIEDSTMIEESTEEIEDSTIIEESTEDTTEDLSTPEDSPLPDDGGEGGEGGEG